VQDSVASTLRSLASSNGSTDRAAAMARDGGANALNLVVGPALTGLGSFATTGVGGTIINVAGPVVGSSSLGGSVRLPYRWPILSGTVEGLGPRDLSHGTYPADSPGVNGLDLASATGITPKGRPAGPGEGAGVDAEGPVPSPRRADLLTELLPYDGRVLESAIDRYLARIDDVGAGLPRFRSTSDLLVELMAVAVSLAASRLAVELFGRSTDDESDLAFAGSGTGFAADSGLNDPWSPGPGVT